MQERGSDDLRRFKLALCALTNAERAVAVLHFCDVSLEEIARRLELSPDRVHMIRAKALRKFRATFTGLDRESLLAENRSDDDPVWPDVAYEFLHQLRKPPAPLQPTSARWSLVQACLYRPQVLRAAAVIAWVLTIEASWLFLRTWFAPHTCLGSGGRFSYEGWVCSDNFWHLKSFWLFYGAFIAARVLQRLAREVTNPISH